MDRKFMGLRLKAARKNKDLTGERLAEMCHINATYLRQIEAGRKIPSLPVFITLCNLLEVSPTYLLEDTLTKNELTDFEVLSQLWSSATPGQIELVTTMIRSALEYMN
ncbi:helix-turn-helix domain-containing protein [Butyricicoccus faecihominis]|uniref:helix-turn-helix domain-containing protein n=1 Tax=Butyricicoccaceae TaxID=3085642 RepID=UPI0024795B4C|nr:MULTISPECIES: helix-turn-helix transcriptional regulator [Butyricicoccaceae]MCQ5130548.1 helix-turn-helix domain-containing protein [Butyricicoccus faecihominis]WNX83974.1 helix-turn-helix transcriptional regulator [Agathobaculum sp. NTUH-O15-33]